MPKRLKTVKVGKVDWSLDGLRELEAQPTREDPPKRSRKGRRLRPTRTKRAVR